MSSEKVLIVASTGIEQCIMKDMSGFLNEKEITSCLSESRDDAIEKINNNSFELLYLPDISISLYSKLLEPSTAKMPDPKYYRMFGSMGHGSYDKFIAAGFELVDFARKKGLEVIVGNDEFNHRLKNMGVHVTNFVTSDSYEQSELIQNVLEKKYSKKKQ